MVLQCLWDNSPTFTALQNLGLFLERKKKSKSIFLFCYIYLYLIIVQRYPVLCVLAFIFSAAPSGLDPSHSGGFSSPHSPSLPLQLLPRFPRLSRELKRLLPDPNSPCNGINPILHPLSTPGDIHGTTWLLWGMGPPNKSQFQSPHWNRSLSWEWSLLPHWGLFPVPCKYLELAQAESLLCCSISSHLTPPSESKRDSRT